MHLASRTVQVETAIVNNAAKPKWKLNFSRAAARFGYHTTELYAKSLAYKCRVVCAHLRMRAKYFENISLEKRSDPTNTATHPEVLRDLYQMMGQASMLTFVFLPA